MCAASSSEAGDDQNKEGAASKEEAGGAQCVAPGSCGFLQASQGGGTEVRLSPKNRNKCFCGSAEAQAEGRLVCVVEACLECRSEKLLSNEKSVRQWKPRPVTESMYIPVNNRDRSRRVFIREGDGTASG